ncbi:hypothetical protein Tco_0847230 [Tanacetum coccineum]
MPGPEHLPPPDYVPSPEEPEQAPLSSNNVPEPEHADLSRDRGYRDKSPTKLRYVDPAEYLLTGGDDGDDEEDEEAEDHLALADYTALHIVDPISSAKDTEAFETDESAPIPPRSPRLRRAGISVQPQTPMAASAEALIAEYAAALTPPSPPPSPLTLLSSPLPQIPSPALPLPSPPTHTSPTYAEAPLGYRAARIRLRAALPSIHHPLEIPSSPLLLPSTIHRDDIPKADMPLWKRACFSTPASKFEVGICAAENRAMTAMGEVNLRVTDLASTQRQDAQELYRIRDEDRLTSHIHHEHDKFRELVRTAEAGPQDGPTDAGSSC